MQVVQFSEYGGPEVLHLADAATPEPGPGMVRIRIRAAAVNPADTKWRSGMFQAFSPVPLPHVVGYDVAGEVDAVGAGVTEPAVGSRVFAKLDPVTKGGYAEYALAPATGAVAMPADLDFATASSIPTAGLTGVQMVELSAKPAAGDLLLITGAVGAVGRFAVVAAKQKNARIVAAVRRTQMDEAKSLGVDDVIVLGEDDWSGPPFNAVLDTVGGEDVGKLCSHLQAGGSIFTAATTPITSASLPSDPVFVMVQDDPARMAELGRAVAAGDVKVPVAKRLPLSQASEAHRLVEAGGTRGEIVLEP